MSTVYFIGGAPRSGKTTLVQEFIRRKPMLAASTDAIRRVAQGTQSPNSNPKLFQVGRGAFGSDTHIQLLRDDTGALLKSEIDACAETWKSVLDFISYYQRDGVDCVIEGVAILPELLKAVNFDYRAVFFINPSDQTEVILSHARENRDDWMGKYDDETIRLYSAFNQQWNQFIADEARKHALPIVEIDNQNFAGSIEKAIRSLLG